MFDWGSKNASVTCKEKRSKLLYMVLHNFINCPVFIDITQIVRYEVATE